MEKQSTTPRKCNAALLPFAAARISAFIFLLRSAISGVRAPKSKPWAYAAGEETTCG
ncbi:hypothetical protein BOTBODRAFT_37433 [Botryobasidium botryosum FD-172 SS1]|uniref:Uncharacterized protein n=1 Tax=Botryobasidium botryosum (strain FD-172 SS1) TaxID=930990 RepID=A0A067LZZ8_BOTB1|nr:hypothetical protein BOTBODRAFT_37433 [Botryobasidium botryosum FD-172 SS1]